MWQSRLEDPHPASYDAEWDSSRSPAPPWVAVDAQERPSAVGAALDSPNSASQRLACDNQFPYRDPAACRAVDLMIPVDPARGHNVPCLSNFLSAAEIGIFFASSADSLSCSGISQKSPEWRRIFGSPLSLTPMCMISWTTSL